MVDAFQAIADDGTPQIVSVSYGEDEGYFGSDAENAEEITLQQMAAEGMTVFASSGDAGAFGDGYNYPYNVSEPGSNPYVTCVGGTSLYTGPHEVYNNETVWNELPNNGATGGGISSVWSLPFYQNQAYTYVDVTLNGGSSTMRNVPDVGAVADPFTGVGVYVKDAGGWLQIGGTSLSCPVWAGYISTINAALKWSGLARLGFFNPILYSSGSQYTYAAGGWFNLIATGSNGYVPDGGPGYSASLLYDNPYYNNCTGFGSMYGGSFAIEVLLSGAQPGNLPGAFTIATPKVTSSSAKATWSASTGASGYVVALYPDTGSFYSLAEAVLLPPDVRTFTFKNMLPNFPYGIYVYAYNASGGRDTSVGFYTPKK